MACKYKVKGTEEWLNESDFKVRLSQGLLDNLMTNNNIKIKGFEPMSMKSQTATTKESALERGNNLINSMNDGDKISEQGVDIERVGDDYFVSYTTEDGGKVSKRKSNKTEALKTLSSKIAKSRAGKNIDLKEYKTEKVNGQDLKVGDIYSRVINGTRYVFKVLSKPYLPTKGMRALGDMNMDVEVLHVGNQVSEMPESSGTGALVENEYTKKVGDKTIDTFRTKSSGGLLLGKVDKINNWKEESAPRAVEQTAPSTEVVAKEEKAASSGNLNKYTPAKATVRGVNIDGYSVKLNEGGKTADVKMPSGKEAKNLKVNTLPSGAKYVVGPNGSTITIPSQVESTTKKSTKAETKTEASTEEKKIRRKPIAGIDNKSSKRAIEIAEKLKFSPNEFTGEESPKDVGLVDTIEVFDKATGRKEVKEKPMMAVIRDAVDKGDITSKEATILENALEEKKKAFFDAKAKAKPTSESKEKIKAKIDEVAESLKSKPGTLKSTLNPLDLLPPSLRNKAIDIAADLAKSGVDMLYALREAVSQVLTDAVLSKTMTQEDAQKIMDNFPSEELLNPKGMAGIKKSLTPTSLKEKASQYTERMTTEELVEEGKRLVDSGEIDVEQMIESIADGKISPNLSGEQVVALSYYKAKLDQEYRDLNKKLSEQVVNGSNADSILKTRQEIALKEVELLNFYIISDITGAAQSVAFSARKILIDNNYDAFFHINKAKGNLNPKNKEIPAELEEKFKELAKRYEELTDRLNKKVEEIERLKNENIINNIKEENKSIKTKNKQTGSKAQNISSNNRKIKVPAKMIRDLVEGGIDNIEDLVNAVKANIADKFPNATTREVRDAITNYARTLNMNADEVKESINIMKSVGRLLSQLEDLQKGIKKEKNQYKKRAMTDREAELKYQIQKALNDIPLTDEEVAKSEEERLASWKKRKENSIKMLTEKLKNEDYSKKSNKKELELDEEAKKLEIEHQMLKDEFELAHEKFKLSQRTALQWVASGLREIWNAPKALIASADLSAPLRQGLLPLVTLAFTKPKMAFKMFLDMHKFGLGKSSNYDEYMAGVKSSPEYKLMKDAGLDITEQNAKISAREENVASNWAKRIPIYGEGTRIKIRGKERKIVPGLDVTGRSERAYSGFLNQLRIEMFQTGAAKLLELGYNPVKDKQVYKDLAHHINNSTGRGSANVREGDIGISEAVNSTSRVLGNILFSPKLIIARINTGFNPLYYARLSPPVRKMALKQIGAFYALTALVVIAAKALDDDDDETWSIEIDPRSSDFAKARIGNTTVDFTGGMAQYARFLTQSIGGYKKMRNGGIYKLGSEYNKPTQGSVIGGFIMNKMSPWANYLTRQSMTIEGSQIEKEMEKESLLYNMAVPIWLQDIEGLHEEHGALGAVGLSILSVYGMGVQQEQERKASSKRKSRARGDFGGRSFGGGSFGNNNFGGGSFGGGSFN